MLALDSELAAADTAQGREALGVKPHPSPESAPPFTLPVVSIIIVNYNYGRYLREAVLSVYAQFYKNVECIVVDNASTDESSTVIEELESTHPSMRVLRRASNGGQCIASAEGFLLSKGSYVVFLDADDVLLPEFVSTHIFTHLSLRINVGATCSDMIQTVENEIVLATFFTVNDFIRAETTRVANLLRPLDTRSSRSWSVDAMLSPVDEGDVYFYERTRNGWPWAATSSFLFRRDAVALVIDNPRFEVFKGPLDVYLARGVNLFTGSVIIDKPLTVYRMHGKNIFSRHPHLNRLINFERGSIFDKERIVRQELIAFLLSRSAFFLGKFENRDDFIDGLIALNDGWPRIPFVRRNLSYVASQLLIHKDDLLHTIEPQRFVRWCVRLGMPWSVLARVGFDLWRRRANDVAQPD